MGLGFGTGLGLDNLIYYKFLYKVHPNANKLLYHLVSEINDAERRYLKFQSGEPPVMVKSAKYERITENRRKLTENYIRGDIDRHIFLRQMGALSLKVNHFLLATSTPDGRTYKLIIIGHQITKEWRQAKQGTNDPECQ